MVLSPNREHTMFFTPVDRRVFLKGTAAAGLALPFADVGSTQAREAELVARKVFFDNADCYNGRVSPDRKNLAWAAPVDNVINLFVAPVADPGAARPVTHITGRSISTNFRWAHTNRHLVFFRDRDGDENYRAFSVDIESQAATPLTPEGGVKSFLQEISHKFPREMLIRHNQRDKRYFDVFRVNVVTGESRLAFENPDFYELFSDSDLQLRFAAQSARHDRMVRTAGGRELAALYAGSDRRRRFDAFPRLQRRRQDVLFDRLARARQGGAVRDGHGHPQDDAARRR